MTGLIQSARLTRACKPKFTWQLQAISEANVVFEFMFS